MMKVATRGTADWAGGFLVSAGTLVWAGTWAAGATITPVARRGAAAPATVAGTTFSQLTSPAINAGGQVVFRGLLSGGGSTSATNTGVWVGTPGHLTHAARAGNAAPGTTSNFAFFDDSTWAPVISDSGAIAFSTEVTGGLSSTRGGVWTGTPGNLALIARSADPAPGTPYYFGTPMLPAMINASGVVAFYDDVRATAGGGVFMGETLFSGAPLGAWTPSATPNTQAPGTPAGVNFAGIKLPNLNDAGGVAFVAQLAGSGVVTDVNDQGLWAGSAASPQLVARMGSQAPGTPIGTVFSVDTGSDVAFDGLTTNVNGRVAFQARLSGTGVTTSNMDGIWSGAPAAATLVAREGSQAVGVPAGVSYALLGMPLLDDDDRVTFHSMLSDGSFGIWSGKPGALAKVVRTGDAAPGIAGATFTAMGSFVTNDVGQTVFGGTASPGQRGLWLADADGDIELLLRYGQPFPVGDGTFKTLSQIDFHFGDGGNGKHGSFNDAGQLAVLARFTDSTSGIYIIQAPEPAGLSLVLVGGLAVQAIRRRRRAP
jgi:hypothetical protein